MTPDSHKKFSWKARGRSFIYAGRGIKRLVSDEHNARIHSAVAIMVIAAGFIFNISASEWCVIALCIGGVLMAEGFNSAIEALADKVCDSEDRLIAKAKDIAAGAVLLFVLASVVCGLIIFLPKLLTLFTVMC